MAEILMPQLGESVTEGTVSKWLVSEGDTVKKYDPICEVTTDKVNAEVPSSFEGTITKIIAAEGDTIPVGELICYIQTENRVHTSEIERKSTSPLDTVQSEGAIPNTLTIDRKQRFSPAVLRLAEEHNLVLSNIQGTGDGGRITRKDILLVIAGDRKSTVTAVKETNPLLVEKTNSVRVIQEDQSTTKLPKKTESMLPVDSGDQKIPVSPVRKMIAKKMLTSKHEAPHAWLTIECDVTNLVNYRNQVKSTFKEKEGVNLTYLPFFIKSVVESLKEFPKINSQWADDEIIIKKAINISIAVATDEALFVPVIKDADQKSIFGLAKEIDKLANKTRKGKLTVEEMSGGTFTVNNTGSFGSISSAPIINHPQAAILSVESIVKRPVIINNMIGFRDMMNLCLSFDHRILDGLVCGRFLQSVKDKIEDYNEETKIY